VLSAFHKTFYHGDTELQRNTENYLNAKALRETTKTQSDRGAQRKN